MFFGGPTQSYPEALEKFTSDDIDRISVSHAARQRLGAGLKWAGPLFLRKAFSDQLPLHDDMQDISNVVEQFPDGNSFDEKLVPSVRSPGAAVNLGAMKQWDLFMKQYSDFFKQLAETMLK